MNTPIDFVCEKDGNSFYIKREDLIPFSFGGNKARKAKLFFEDIDKGDFDCVVTYGSGGSNHCRVIANMAAQRNLECIIISPAEASKETANSRLISLLGAKTVCVPVNEVHDTIEGTLAELKKGGRNPYFIQGGGHGNIGTEAYVQCYDEIKQFEKDNGIFFDFIFFASGTGTTQSGLVCGQILHADKRKIIGISIARKNPRGRNVVIDSIKEYLPDTPDEIIENDTVFVDEYTGEGYAKSSTELANFAKKIFTSYGIPLDVTYTAKAAFGMTDYIEKNGIENKNILFIHTGGTPLFFDDIKNNN